MAKVTRYLIKNTDNMGHRGFLGKEFRTRQEARNYIDKLLSKPSYNIGNNGQRIYRTAYRDAISGTGINNPRIVKMVVNRQDG